MVLQKYVIELSSKDNEKYLFRGKEANRERSTNLELDTKFK